MLHNYYTFQHKKLINHSYISSIQISRTKEN